MKPTHDNVRAKKHLGQHFLKDEKVAEDIALSLSGMRYSAVVEIGPGMGVLTQYLCKQDKPLYVVEIDTESVAYLHKYYPNLAGRILEEDFLKLDWHKHFGEQQMAIVGNFPYNISTQIVFKMLEHRTFVPEFGGMFQKEVAERICAKPGSKVYGILSVLTQAFYEANYLFSVPPHVFQPPPKVVSGVLHLNRKDEFSLPCSEKFFFNVVKTAFNQRRKTLRNSLKTFGLSDVLKEDSIFDRRPEQLSVQEFIHLTQMLEADGVYHRP